MEKLNRKKRALIIGNSDGIGLQLSRDLLHRGWSVEGVSRSSSPLVDSASPDAPEMQDFKDSYEHHVLDITDPDYPKLLENMLKAKGAPDVCVFCAGIGGTLHLEKKGTMQLEEETFAVNLTAMVQTLSWILPAMRAKEEGHFIGLSSLADSLVSGESPAYTASKAAFSNYLEGVSLALKDQKQKGVKQGVYVTNVRFGFVDTKMAKGSVKPFQIDVETASRHLLKVIAKKPIRYSVPKAMILLVKLISWFSSLRIQLH